MVERPAEKIPRLSAIKFVETPSEKDFKEYRLMPGHSKSYRGNHRSHTRGAGIMALLRDGWKKTLKG